MLCHNVKPKTLKLPEENILETCNLGLKVDFLDMKPKARSLKENIETLINCTSAKLKFLLFGK